MIDEQWWFYLGCFMATVWLWELMRQQPPSYKVVSLHRFKREEVVSLHRWYWAAELAAFSYSVVAPDDTVYDIWRI